MTWSLNVQEGIVQCVLILHVQHYLTTFLRARVNTLQKNRKDLHLLHREGLYYSLNNGNTHATVLHNY